MWRWRYGCGCELVVVQVLNLKRALRSPVETAAHAVGSAVRSTTFLAAFVGLYSSAISLHRRLFSWDHKLLYYVAGSSPPATAC